MIDWPFIYAREDGPRGRAHDGYWPGGRSGVTIADGVDLGYLGRDETLAMPGDLQPKLVPYLGLTGLDAHKALFNRPLHLTDDECEQLEAPKRAKMLDALRQHYDRASHVPFDDIPGAAQTVLMSVTWQYGDPWARTPHFWGICCRQDWRAAIAGLRDFHDAYPTRRNVEADYLERHLQGASEQ